MENKVEKRIVGSPDRVPSHRVLYTMEECVVSDGFNSILSLRRMNMPLVDKDGNVVVNHVSVHEVGDGVLVTEPLEEGKK